MIKGNSRHVVVIKNPDNRNFEEAIFIVRSGLFRNAGKSEEEIMREAKAAAKSFVRRMKTEDLMVK
ncbi:MAG: hypothetical protein ACI4XQ_01500 [Eubacteriales bacterium]|nr:hypothetical protein [Clostridiales bacterium]